MPSATFKASKDEITDYVRFAHGILSRKRGAFLEPLHGSNPIEKGALRREDAAAAQRQSDATPPSATFKAGKDGVTDCVRCAHGILPRKRGAFPEPLRGSNPIEKAALRRLFQSG